jgi:glyoxylase-like metal-dependent hydrolase (beta-lactamase superfamily II)
MLKRILLAFALLGLLAACVSQNKQNDATALPEPSLEKIAGGVWIHKSYKDVPPWGPVLSQGLVVKSRGRIIMVDTAWTDADTEGLLALVNRKAGALPESVIITHAHEDKMGGAGALHRHGIETFAHVFANEDAPERGLTPAQTALPLEVGATQIVVGAGIEYETYYPGPGHTRDNLVVYYPDAKVLFGGCLIRPGGSDNLGNTADADIGYWAEAVRNVAAAFPDAEIIIPSHGPMGGRELLDHTIALAEAAASKR